MYTTEFLALGKALNIYINYSIFGIRKDPEYLYQLFNVLPKEKTFDMRALHVYKFTFNIDFMMKRKLNFSVTRNNFGHILIRWYVTLVVEMNFSLIIFDKLLKIVSFPASCVIYNENALLMMYYDTGIYFVEYKI